MRMNGRVKERPDGQRTGAQKAKQGSCLLGTRATLEHMVCVCDDGSCHLGNPAVIRFRVAYTEVLVDDALHLNARCACTQSLHHF